VSKVNQGRKVLRDLTDEQVPKDEEEKEVLRD